MPGKYKVKIEVAETTEPCHAGHKVGDVWETDSPQQPLAICPVALTAIWQKIYAMMFGAEFWFAPTSEEAHFSCPDKGIVTFKITREEI